MGDVTAARVSSRVHAASARLLRTFPPVRLLWISLTAVGLAGIFFLRGLGVVPLVVVPSIAVTTDLLLQRLRYRRIGAPDAALATGLFVALLFPPTASPWLTGAVAVVAIVLRHVLRFRGHPWVNPAALGVVLGSVLLGLGPAWWVAIGPVGLEIMVALGVVVLLRNRGRRRLPLMFFGVYLPVVALEHLALGASATPQILLLEILDPSTLFFGLFMVTEPRTSPASLRGQLLFGAVIGFGAATVPLVLPSIGILVALLGANLLYLGYRARPAPRRHRSATPRPSPVPAVGRWTLPVRGGVVLAATIVLIVAAGSTPIPSAGRISSGPPPRGGPSTLASCAQDNASIPAGTLSSLHSQLGPSVVLSYASNTGEVVFFDPVDHVTVYETDLYEDYGYAEFNGDDYAVNGCVT